MACKLILSADGRPLATIRLPELAREAAIAQARAELAVAVLEKQADEVRCEVIADADESLAVLGAWTWRPGDEAEPRWRSHDGRPPTPKRRANVVDIG